MEEKFKKNELLEVFSGGIVWDKRIVWVEGKDTPTVTETKDALYINRGHLDEMPVAGLKSLLAEFYFHEVVRPIHQGVAG